jgi:hypothetical protein
MHMHHDEARQRLEKRLRRQVPDSHWDYLVKKDYVKEFLDPEEPFSLDDLVKEAEELAAAVPATAARQTRPANGPPLSAVRPPVHLSTEASTYQHALSEVVAAVADLDVDVLAFRSKVLADETMSWDQVEAWVKEREAEQGDPTRWITCALPTSGFDEAVTYNALLERSSVEARFLRYLRSSGDWEAQVATVAGGVLERLRRLSVGLSQAHAWTEAQATVFVLTGLTPTVSMIRTTDRGTNVRHGTWCAWSEVITLKVNPAVSVEELASTYRAARQRYGQRRTSGSYRIRTQSLKHLRLASFVARRRPAAAWGVLMQEWNQQCDPGEEYPHVSNFRRDAALAQERLLYRGAVRPRGVEGKAPRDSPPQATVGR